MNNSNHHPRLQRQRERSTVICYSRIRVTVHHIPSPQKLGPAGASLVGTGTMKRWEAALGRGRKKIPWFLFFSSLTLQSLVSASPLQELVFYSPHPSLSRV